MNKAVEEYYDHDDRTYDDFVSVESVLDMKMERIFHPSDSPVPDSLARVLCTAQMLRRLDNKHSVKLFMDDMYDGLCFDHWEDSVPRPWSDNHHFHVVKWLLQKSVDQAPNSTYLKIQRALADAHQVANGGITEADIELATMIEHEGVISVSYC
jgi:hypothetical protein